MQVPKLEKLAAQAAARALAARARAGGDAAAQGAAALWCECLAALPTQLRPRILGEAAALQLLSDEALAALLGPDPEAWWHLLPSLSLAGCGLLSGGAVVQLLRSCQAPALHGGATLTQLNLSRVLLLADADLEVALPLCPALVALDLSHCVRLADGAPAAVARALPELQRLSLAGCLGVAAVDALAACADLRSLDLGGCWRVDGAAASELLWELTRLEHLSLRGCAAFDGFSMPPLPAAIHGGLTSLDLRGTRAPRTAVLCAALMFPRLRSCHLSGAYAGAGTGAAAAADGSASEGEEGGLDEGGAGQRGAAPPSSWRLDGTSVTALLCFRDLARRAWAEACAGLADEAHLCAGAPHAHFNALSLMGIESGCRAHSSGLAWLGEGVLRDANVTGSCLGLGMDLLWIIGSAMDADRESASKAAMRREARGLGRRLRATDARGAAAAGEADELRAQLRQVLWALAVLLVLRQNANGGLADALLGMVRQASDPAEWLSCTSGVAALTALDLGQCGGVTDRALQTLSDSCSGLRSLSLAGQALSDAGLVALSALTRLTYLDLGGCKSRAPGGSRQPLTGFTRLRGAEEGQASQQQGGAPTSHPPRGDLITAAGVAAALHGSLRGEAEADAGLGLGVGGAEAGLVALRLQGLPVGDGLVGRMCGLTQLDLSGCRSVSDVGVLQALRTCRGLRDLRLRGCRALTPAALGFSGPRLPLQTAAAPSPAAAAASAVGAGGSAKRRNPRPGSSPAACIRIAPVTRQLPLPAAAGAAAQSDGAAAAAASSTGSWRLPDLAKLSLPSGMCTDAMLHWLAGSGGCLPTPPPPARSAIPTPTRFAGAAWGSSPQAAAHVGPSSTEPPPVGRALLGAPWVPLRRLQCAGCGSVADAGVAALARGCPQLHTLLLYGATNVGSAAAAAVAEGCPLLRRLALTRSACLDDAGLAALAPLQCLQSLDVRGCAQLTDEGFAALFAAPSQPACWRPIRGEECAGGDAPAAAAAGQLSCPPEVAALQATEPLLRLMRGLCERQAPSQETFMPGGPWPEGVWDDCRAAVASLLPGVPPAPEATSAAAGARAPPSLRRHTLLALSADGCTRLSDAAVVAAAAACPDLSTLELRNCPDVTRVSLVAVSLLCANMQVLALQGTGVNSVPAVMPPLPRDRSIGLIIAPRAFGKRVPTMDPESAAARRMTALPLAPLQALLVLELPQACSRSMPCATDGSAGSWAQRVRLC